MTFEYVFTPLKEITYAYMCVLNSAFKNHFSTFEIVCKLVLVIIFAEIQQ